jgi:hypothetical protein
MFSLKTSVAICVAAGAVSAQAIDLNGLTLAASRFANGGMQSQPLPLVTDLRLMRGERIDNPSLLMAKATDVQRWTIFYGVSIRAGATEVIAHPQSASLKCTHGHFSDFLLSAPPIPKSKSLENTWFAISLDGAIGQLNAQGYVRGFSKVEVKWPDATGFLDEPVYIFKCPWERADVAISVVTGALVWYQMF